MCGLLVGPLLWMQHGRLRSPARGPRLLAPERGVPRGAQGQGGSRCIRCIRVRCMLRVAVRAWGETGGWRGALGNLQGDVSCLRPSCRVLHSSVRWGAGGRETDRPALGPSHLILKPSLIDAQASRKPDRRRLKSKNKMCFVLEFFFPFKKDQIP